MGSARDKTCKSCNKTFSKSEHLTRHLRSHTNERPYECSVCGKVYSRSDVLRRHARSHQDAPRQSPDHSGGEITGLTPLSEEISHPSAPGENPNVHVSDLYSTALEQGWGQERNSQSTPGMNLYDPLLYTDANSWFLGAPLDVDALDFTLTSAVSEWAQIAPMPSVSGLVDIRSPNLPTPTPTGGAPTKPDELPVNTVKQNWFTRLPVQQETGASQYPLRNNAGVFGQGNVAADENYRASLSRKLQPRMHEESLPPASQLNLFASLFFSRFHSLLPVVHVPSFKLTTENSLLFISICSVGSLFVGSSYAVAQGARLFERLNKAILASWESILSRSCSDALSMVQAAIIGQTFAILSGRSKDLVLADVLHGTVNAWARESHKNALPAPSDPSEIDLNEDDLAQQWSRWIDHEQRKRVEIALNIHDAELACLLLHEPIRKHRLAQYPRLASDALFMAPNSVKWAELYKETAMPSPRNFLTGLDNSSEGGETDSKFAAYGILESINAHVSDARRSISFDEHEFTRLSNMLIWWWKKYSFHFLSQEEDDPFALPVLWHSIYISIYADMDLLEQACGRDGQSAAAASSLNVRSWSGSLAASKCLVHAFLIQRYLERMRVSIEPAIHVPRSLFGAALCLLCFTQIGGQQRINPKAFDAPEIQLLLSPHATPPWVLEKTLRDSTFADVNHVHRLIDLLNRVGRWATSYLFASVLSAILESKQGT